MRWTVLAVLVLSIGLPGQMEKRLRVLYDRAAFRALAPAVGQRLPELTLTALDGKSVKLSSLRQKPLVVIGGAYT